MTCPALGYTNNYRDPKICCSFVATVTLYLLAACLILHTAQFPVSRGGVYILYKPIRNTHKSNHTAQKLATMAAFSTHYEY